MSIPSPAVQRGPLSKRLIEAAGAGDFESIEALLAAGLDINTQTEHGMTALMSAAAKGRERLVTHLLTRGADITARRQDGLDALALAVFFGHPEVVRQLLDKGADAKTGSRFGGTLEAWAKARGFSEIAQILSTAKSVKTSGKTERAVSAEAEEKPVDNADRFVTNVSLAPVQIHLSTESSKDTSSISSLKAPTDSSLRVTTEVPQPICNGTEERFEANAFVNWLACMTSSWPRLTALTMAVMLISGLGTLAALKLLNTKSAVPPAATSAAPQTPNSQQSDATAGTSGVLALKRSINTTPSGESGQAPATIAAQEPLEASSNLLRVKTSLRPSEEVTTELHRKPTETTKRETREKTVRSQQEVEASRSQQEAATATSRRGTLATPPQVKEEPGNVTSKEQTRPAPTRQKSRTVAKDKGDFVPVRNQAGNSSQDENSVTAAKPDVKPAPPIIQGPVASDVQRSKPPVKTAASGNSDTTSKKPRTRVIQWP